MMGNKKLQVWLPLLFALVLTIGMFLGYQLNGGSGGSGFFSANRRSALQEAMDLIRLKYVDSVREDSLQGRAIQEMMNQLDPHSVYFPPQELKEVNEDLAGNFEGGIGVEFNVFNDTVNVIYVVPNGPSEAAGLRIGDKIIKVNDSLLTGKPFSTDEIKNIIRGKDGSVASMQLIRDGKPATINVTRGTIPVSPIDAAYMITPETGYIKLNKFTNNSYAEFMQALEALQKQGLKSLVFDLRGNGGGFMNEAVEMADEFLDGDKLIVYTQGVNSTKREYRCKRPGLFEQGKLVVLVDELSASATEVLAGALQDWCRATIIGRRTFGKGLVQEQYPLSDGSAIRLTVARYYTPLGRSIQRSYGQGKKVYMDDLWNRFSSGEMLSADSIKNHNGGKAYYSVCHDTLYGGDGITPNIFVPFDTSHSVQRTFLLINNSRFSSFVYYYYLQHRAQLDQYKSAGEMLRRLNDAELWEGLLQYTAGDTTHFALANVTEKTMLETRLKALLVRYKWRNSGFFEALNADDPVVKKALEQVGK